MSKTQEELKKLKEEYETITKKLDELSEEELESVVGGQTLRSKTITIPVSLPEGSYNPIVLTVYVDGILDSSYTKSVDPIISITNLSFKGIEGFITVTIKLNNLLYKSYSINFDERSYNEISVN